MTGIVPSYAQEGEVGRYRLPGRFVSGFLWATLALRPRSFARDARLVIAGLEPALEVHGAQHIPRRGGYLVVCNHYTRPGLAAWWFVFAISATIAERRAPGADAEVRWIITSGWTFPSSRRRQRLLRPLTHWAFRRVAHVYGFVTMPPMPPDPREVMARAQAVRRSVLLARQAARDGGMVGLAPEGRDTPELVGQFPPGVGRFVALLVEEGLEVLPAGVVETEGRLRVAFGPPFVPDIPPERGARDGMVARQVREAIVRQVG